MPPAPLADARILITGATAGIGEATALAFASAGVKELLLNGRRKDRLEALAKRIREAGKTKVTPLAFDVADRAAVDRIEKERPDAFDVDVLVNNAGLARGVDPIQAGDPAGWREMVETNVLGLLYVTRKVAPRMIAKRRGHIVNLGSVAARWAYPGGNVYAATKAAVHMLGETMRMDLHGTGVRVTTIAPGLVETEFSVVRFRGDAERAEKVYADADVLRPADVADAILWCCTRPPHVNVQELVLYPTDQAHPTMVQRRGRRAT